jgi:short-subunit dehydrogenase
MRGKTETMVPNAARVIGGISLIASSLAYLAFRNPRKTGGRSAYNLSNKIVVITGGSRGLGLALARQFISEGARVALLARDKETLQRAQESLTQDTSAHVIVVRCDLTDRKQVEAALQVVRLKLGPIDVLVNNAGLISVGPMDSMTLDDFRDSLNLHFWTPLYTTLSVLPEMRRRKQGRIVNISSIGGKISVPHLLPYSVGKFALAGFSEGLRSEAAKDNVLVTSVYPGLMRTGSPRNASFKGKHRSEYAWFSISDSLPGISVNADSAARQIVNACKRGRSHLIVSLPAKVGIKLHQLFPRASASALSKVNRLLPSIGANHTRSRKGKDSKSRLSPSWLTFLDELAAHRNNEVTV